MPHVHVICGYAYLCSMLTGGTLDTQTTTPWVGTESPASGLLPSMPLLEVMALDKNEVGPVLFSGEFRLSAGAIAFKEFLVTDFMAQRFPKRCLHLMTWVWAPLYGSFRRFCIA